MKQKMQIIVLARVLVYFDLNFSLVNFFNKDTFQEKKPKWLNICLLI